jgi:hypothetical protein
MSAEIDWQRLASELGLLRADVESGGSDYARRALELIFGEDGGVNVRPLPPNPKSPVILTFTASASPSTRTNDNSMTPNRQP